MEITLIVLIFLVKKYDNNKLFKTYDEKQAQV